MHKKYTKTKYTQYAHKSEMENTKINVLIARIVRVERCLGETKVYIIKIIKKGI